MRSFGPESTTSPPVGADGSAKVVLLAPFVSDRIRQLTARMRSGDETAFEEFYEQFADRLFRYLLVLTRGNEEQSRELLQTTMSKIARRPQEFQSEAHLWHWLATIARNGFIDDLRRNQRGPEFVPLLAVELPIESTPAREDAPLLRALDHGLQDLETDERSLIARCYFEGNSHQTVAAQEQTTAKAVESKLARLRQKLRAAILRHLRHEND